MQALAREAPRLRCELVEAEPEQALPALALGDVDLVLGDEWQHQPRRLPPGLERHELLRDPVQLVLPAAPPGRARGTAPRCRSPSSPARPWATGHAGMGWEEMTERTCREHGGFEPDIRHRTNDATSASRWSPRGLAVTLLPDLVARRPRHPGSRCAAIAEAPGRAATIFAVTRATDAARPSTQALVAAVHAAAAAL